MSDLENKFVRSMLGLALGDALGARYEGGPFGQALWWALGVGKRDRLRWSDDTDMIGAMAGGIFGARHGSAALPADALERLEERGWIETTARELYSVTVVR